MKSLLVALLLAVSLSMPQIPSGAELTSQNLLSCGEFVIIIADYKNKDGSSWLVYSTIAEDVFAIVEYNKQEAFIAAHVYENGQVVKHTSVESMMRHSTGPCEDGREMLKRKQGAI